MRPLWGVGSACALVLLAAEAGPARAAWNNVFQVCCNSCRSQPAVAHYQPVVANYGAPDPCCNPCPPPQPVCTTRYVQRCYYQPVTCYQTKTYYQPVTTYRTSYYYEPVTSYRYSCYYDPCTCSYQQVACPTTCYRLRSQCCPVQSWVQRCCQVPVTSYRVASYWEPVTTCCQPQNPCQPTAVSAAVNPCPPNGAPTQPPLPTAPPPAGVTEQRAPAGLGAGAGVQENIQRGTTGSPLYDRYYPQAAPPVRMPGVEGSSLRQAPTMLPPVAPPAPPAVRLDRVVSVPRADLNGQVVLANNAPRSNARLLFVSLARGANPQQVTADGSGRFRVTLASGGWLVYVNDAQNKPVFHSKIELLDNDNRQVTLVAGR